MSVLPAGVTDEERKAWEEFFKAKKDYRDEVDALRSAEQTAATLARRVEQAARRMMAASEAIRSYVTPAVEPERGAL